MGSGAREWHVQACWSDHSISGLWVAPLTRVEFANVLSAESSSFNCEIGDRWHLGSCTKAMTGTLLAVLVEEGVVSWDLTLGATVSAVFEGMELEIPNGNGDITVLQLLTQKSGVSGNPCPENEWSLAWSLHNTSGKPPQEQRREFSRVFMMNVPLHTAPGASPKHVYNNVNFTLVALVAEEVTGCSWEELMTERLFAPLGISSAGFGAPGAEEEEIEYRRSHP